MTRGPKCHSNGGKLVFFSLILLALLAPSTSGSCLSYGHSCWGAHGKRNGASVVRPSLTDGESSGGGGPSDAGGGQFEGRWYLSKLIPASSSLSKGSTVTSSEEAGPPRRPHHLVLGEPQNNDTPYEYDDEDAWQENPSELRSESEVLVMAAEPRNRRPSQKMRLYKILNKRSSGAAPRIK